MSVRSIAKDGSELRVTSGIDHGNSGSPATSDDGEVMGIARAAGVVVSIEPYGSLIPSSLAQAIVTGMIARPDHTPRQVSCESKAPARTSPPTTSRAATRPGSESAGLWIAQLGSSNFFGNTDAVAADLKKLQELDGSIRYLFSQDWPATFVRPTASSSTSAATPRRNVLSTNAHASTSRCHPSAWFANSSAETAGLLGLEGGSASRSGNQARDRFRVSMPSTGCGLASALSLNASGRSRRFCSRAIRRAREALLDHGGLLGDESLAARGPTYVRIS